MIYSPRAASQGVAHEGNISHIAEGQDNDMLYISVEEVFQCEQKICFLVSNIPHGLGLTRDDIEL